MKLYKYMDLKHAKSLVTKGSFRIGTLFEYRDIEQHGEEVGDDAEGTRTVYANDKLIHTEIPELIPPNFDEYFGKAFPKGSEFHGIKFQTKESCTNHYISCFSSTFDKGVMREFGYNCCVEIIEPDKFMSCYLNILVKRGLCTGQVHYDCCDYSLDKFSEIRTVKHTPIWIMKPKRYAYQNEYRFTFQPTQSEINPIVISSYNAKKHCRVIHVSR